MFIGRCLSIKQKGESNKISYEMRTFLYGSSRGFTFPPTFFLFLFKCVCHKSPAAHDFNQCWILSYRHSLADCIRIGLLQVD